MAKPDGDFQMSVDRLPDGEIWRWVRCDVCHERYRGEELLVKEWVSAGQYAWRWVVVQPCHVCRAAALDDGIG